MNRDLRLITLSLLIWGFGEGMFIYFQPLYLSQLGADPALIGAILGLAAFGMLLSHLPAGALADHFGRRLVMAASWAMGTLATFLMALAGRLPLFAAGVVLYSFSAFVYSPMQSYITEARGTWSPARALTTVTAGFSAGSILGPILGGQVAEAFGLRAVYILATGIFVISTALVLLVREQQVEPARSGRRYQALLTNRRLGGFLALVFLINLALYLAWPLTPNYLQTVHAVSVSQIGLLGAFTGLGVVIFNLVLGRLQAKRGLVIGQILAGAAALALWQGRGLGAFALGYFLFACYRTSRSMITASIHGLVWPAELGLAFGANETVAAASLMVAAPIAGLLYTRSPALPFPVGIGLIALSVLLSLAFAPGARAEVQPEPARERGVVGGV